METAAGRTLTDLDLARLCVLAFLHDVGKASAGFYAKGEPAEIAEHWRQSARIGGSYIARGHVQVVSPIFQLHHAHSEALQQAIGIHDILAWANGDDLVREDLVKLWLAAISHHGTPLTWSDVQASQTLREALPSWMCPINGYEPLQGLRELAATARQILPEAFDLSAPPMRFGSAMVHAFAGLVSLADWIGSNAEEGFFPYDLVAAQDATRWEPACRRAERVLRAMRVDVEAARTELQARPPTFQDLFDGNAPRAMQSELGQLDLAALVVVEAETGSGKTEAALWRFKTLFENAQVDALCFLLPTRVSATAIAQRVQSFIDRLVPNPNLRPAVVLAVPGYLRANGHDGQALAGFEVLWPDDRDPSRRPLYWAAEHSKRYFAATCATGTIDQFLLSTLQTKHAHLRGTALLRALVVVDEVHASDPYMTALLRAALARHVRCGGHGLMMSATLTGEERARLVQAGQPQARRRGPPKASPLAAGDAPYPAVTDMRGIRACPQTAQVKRIRRRPLPLMRDPAAVADLVAQAVSEGARVLVIRNTVGQAVATQQAIEARLGMDHAALLRIGGVHGTVAMHHGRYAFEDRRCLDLAVEAAFGKPAMRDQQARVLVGTQTLEISLDCDADWLITDIVPIDVLLQRLGRLHRHRDRDAVRPERYRSAEVVVLTPASRDLATLLTPGGAHGLGLGARSAYDNLLAIEAAWRMVEDEAHRPEWLIPQHNRELVEAGADSQELSALADALGGPWPKAHQDVYGKYGAQAAQAAACQVRWDQDWNDGRWSDLGEEVRTRLGLDNIDLDLLQPWESPLQQTLTRLSAPRWMLPASDGPVPTIATQQADGGGLLLSVAGRTLRYDRLGLRAL